MLARMIVWPRIDQKGKVLHWFLFPHIDSWSQVEWKHDLDNPAKLRMTLSALPTVQPTVEHSTSCLSFPIWHISRETVAEGRGAPGKCGLELTSVVKIQEGWRTGTLLVSQRDRFQDSEWRGLERMNCFVKQGESSRQKMLSFRLVLKRITESEKWKWPCSFTLTSVFISLWGTWVSETWMRSHKISDRVKTRTKLFLHLRSSSILETSLCYYFIALLIPHFHRGKEGSGSEWRWNTNM